MKPAPDRYSSPLSEFCAEELPGDFHYLDGDEVLFRHSALPIVYARETGILRILESKFPGEDLRRSQRETFPLLAAAIEKAVEASLLSDGSGVFVVEGTPPFGDGALVRKVHPAEKSADNLGIRFAGKHNLAPAQFHLFMRCRRRKTA